MKQMSNMKKPEVELELVMLSFAVLYKNHVLTDSKMINLASTMIERETQNQEDATVVDSLDNVYGETEKAILYLA